MDKDAVHLVVDVETFGLDVKTGPIIEFGIVGCTLDFEILFESSWLFWSPAHGSAYRKMLEEGDGFVHAMHNKSGLWGAVTEAKVDGSIVENRDWFYSDFERVLNDFDIPVGQVPMTGNNISFDRRHIIHSLPGVDKFFHYRTIDISSVKELCRRYNPALFAVREDGRKKEEATHRSIADCHDSIAELQFYAEEFLFDGRPQGPVEVFNGPEVM